MPETLSEYFQRRGSLGVLVVLKSGPRRFTDLEDVLHISTSTLTARLGEARDFGLIVPEIDENETSVDDQYRITERGQYVVRKMETLDVVHAYRTLLDMHRQVEDGREELTEWLEEEDVKRKLALQSETDPYVDPFGHNVTGHDEGDQTNRRYE
jgi:DNA-binding HxlR family transcriptional regulator